MSARVQELFELGHIPTNAHALNGPRHGLEVVGQGFVATKVGRHVGYEDGTRRYRVDEVKRKRLAGLDEAVKVAVKEGQAKEGEHICKDEVERRTGLGVNDEVIKRRWCRSAVVVSPIMRHEEDGSAVTAVSRVIRQVWISIDRPVALLSDQL